MTQASTANSPAPESVGPFVSVVIPTRFRPELLERAVRSVQAQDWRDLEVLVVDDGSDAPTAQRCQEMLAQLGENIHYLHLGQHQRGRGPAYARNVGAWQARGRFIAFLDDDDEWTDTAYLGTLHGIASKHADLDLLFAHQTALSPDDGGEKSLWLRGLIERLQHSGRPLVNGCYPLTREDVASHPGFCHLNTTVVRRDLFSAMGGFDEYLRYEEDLDFYLRAVDAASKILLLPRVVARHYVPAPHDQASASQSLRQVERLACRRQLLVKAVLNLESGLLQGYCVTHLANTEKRMVELMAAAGEYRKARFIAAQVAASARSFRWLLYTVWLGWRARSRRRGRDPD